MEVWSSRLCKRLEGGSAYLMFSTDEVQDGREPIKKMK